MTLDVMKKDRQAKQERTKMKTKWRKRNSWMPKKRNPSPVIPVRPSMPQGTVNMAQQKMLSPILSQRRKDKKSLPHLGMGTDRHVGQSHWSCSQWFRSKTKCSK